MFCKITYYCLPQYRISKWKYISIFWIFSHLKNGLQSIKTFTVPWLTVLVRGAIQAKTKESRFCMGWSFQQHVHWWSHYRCLCPDFHKVNLLQGLYTSLKASIIAFDSLCHTFKHLVIFVCLWTEIQSNCCSIKDFLLFPLNSICLLSPTKYTSAHTPKYTHPTESEMTHLAQTISSKNSDQLLIYFWRFH